FSANADRSCDALTDGRRGAQTRSTDRAIHRAFGCAAGAAPALRARECRANLCAFAALRRAVGLTGVVEAVVHLRRRVRGLAAPDHARRHAGHGAVRRHVVQHHAAGADLGALAHDDVAENLRAGAHEHAAADLRVPVARFLAGPAERHFVQPRHVSVDHRGLADDEAGAVIEQDAAPDARGRMDVDAEALGNAIVEDEGEAFAPLAPAPARDA